MSLLMDALKQAEHAKRGTQSENPPRVPPTVQAPVDETPASMAELSLTPVESSATPAAPAPPVISIERETAPHLQLATTTDPKPEPETPSAPPVVKTEPKPDTSEPTSTLAPAKTDHHNAQAAARILAASASRHETQRRRNLIGLIGLGAMLVIAIGSYYYYATLAQNTPYLSVAQPPAMASVDSTQANDAAPDNVAQAAPALLDIVPPKQTTWQDGPPPPEPLITQDWEPAPIDPRVLRGEQPLPIADQGTDTAPAATPAASIRITRTTAPNQVNQDLQTAYVDFQAGRLAQAEQGYRQVLARDANNRDAGMGLAAIAVRSGQLDIARAQYYAIVKRNPKDMTARAALTDLGLDRPANTESELKSLLAEQPQSAQLYFTLANLYAEQQRWPYAQQAYFEAQRLAPEHPDYAFNLAVSLEHIGQSRVALEYYRRAVQLAGRHSAQFDLRAAQQRIDALSAQAKS